MSTLAKRKRNEITAESANCTIFNAIDNRSFTTCTSPPNTPFYIDLGDCTCICEYCGARFWYDERCHQTSVNGHMRYKQCCKEGKVKLPFPGAYNPTIINLFTRNEFLNHIRAYNSMFSMTSFGAKVDDRINDGSAPYVFRVEGQICHWIGTLCPPRNEKPRFLQMYIYDTENEITHRLEPFNSSTEPQLSVNFVSLISKELAMSNKLVKLFHTARDLIRLYNVPNFSIRLYSSYNAQSYDKPSDGCIGAIVNDSDPLSDGFDIVIRNKDKGPQRINKLHLLYMSLQYPLLFIYGESGWSPDMRLTAPAETKDRKLTMNMFYNYQLHDRLNLYTLLLRGGRLFQQYLVDAYVCMEHDRLDYYRYNQSTFRTEHLQGVHDAVSRGDTEGRDIGKRIILPTSFIGGPRYMYKHYQDALAICRVHGNPQYFVTFTCNVKWPEIERHMAQYAPLKAQDRPDIIARVFQLKLKSLLNFIKTENPFGDIEADLYTIEFQKRGMPHRHLLLWVSSSQRIKDAEDIDKYISAEIPDRVLQPDLYRIVSESMMHGPCGLARTNSPCMKLGHCSKKFPKIFEQTTCFDKNGYARYRRRSTTATVVKNGIPLDNRVVVPYNPLLCLYFEAHINVEYCGWSMLIKYLFKYISKSPDRIHYLINRTPAITSDATTNTNPIQVDEIKNFVDSRFICPHEAAWRILNFHIHERNPPVQMLAVHLENMQSVRFKDKINNVANNSYATKTTLTKWLLSNRYD
uniref:uncharacterized protein LOC122601004 n=1 Tax=Erigeron canadensis TaxID=72917 RepID=UPI001CB9B882|nr:uncharacterized protein LOC122601004 [Erigeron canadensis]